MKKTLGKSEANSAKRSAPDCSGSISAEEYQNAVDKLNHV